MPFTVFHWGFPYVFGELFFGKDKRKVRIQIMTFLAATISDVEGFLHIIGYERIQLHGPLHSLLGCLAIGLSLIGLVEIVHRRFVDEIVTEDDFIPRYFKWKITRNEKLLYLVSPLIFQLGLDVWMYNDIELFWPISSTQNALASQGGSYVVTNVATIFLFISIIWFIINFIRSMVKHMNLDGFDPQ